MEKIVLSQGVHPVAPSTKNHILPPFHNRSHSIISHIHIDVLDSLTSIEMWKMLERLILWNEGSSIFLYEYVFSCPCHAAGSLQ